MAFPIIKHSTSATNSLLTDSRIQQVDFFVSHYCCYVRPKTFTENVCLQLKDTFDGAFQLPDLKNDLE